MGQASEQAGQDRKCSSLAEVDDPTRHSSNLSPPNSGGQRSALLMTCQVAIAISDGCMTKARALIDYASLVSFVTERSEQRLRLPHQRKPVQVAGIGGDEHTSWRSVVTFGVENLKSLDVGRISGPNGR